MASSSDPQYPTVQHFSKDQRARLEALTFARSLTRNNVIGRYAEIGDWLRLADYIIKGDR